MLRPDYHPALTVPTTKAYDKRYSSQIPADCRLKEQLVVLTGEYALNDVVLIVSALFLQVWNSPKGTVFPDFTNPKVIPYWLKHVTELHQNVPFDGLWIVSYDCFVERFVFFIENCQ